MYERYLIVLCVIFGALDNVQSGCNSYVNCFGDIINDFFSDALINTTILHRKDDVKNIIKKVNEDESDEIDVGKVFIEVVKALKELIANDSTLNADSKYEALKHINDKTSIYINAFNLNKFPDSVDEKVDKQALKTTKLLPVFVPNHNDGDENDKTKFFTYTTLGEVHNDMFKSNVFKNNTLSSKNITINYDDNLNSSIRIFDAINETSKFYETLNATIKLYASLNDTTINASEVSPLNFSVLNGNAHIEFQDLIPLKVLALPSTENAILTETTTDDFDLRFNLSKDVVPSHHSSNKDVTTINYDMILDEISILKDEIANSSKSEPVNENSNTVTVKNNAQNEMTLPQLITKMNNRKHNLSIDLQTYFRSKANEIASNKEGTGDNASDFLEDEPDYLMIDYLDIFKDTIPEANVYPTTEVSYVTESYSEVNCDSLDCTPATESASRNTPAPLPSVYPWVVAIYIKHDGNDQFEYYCDGALMSDRCILTAARCVWHGNQTLETNDIIAILGKQNLKVMKYEERIVRVNQITVHPNFSIKNKEAISDLAMLHMENAVIFSDRISPARLENEEDIGDIVKAATTGWAFSGQLTPIHFEQQISDYCKSKTKGATFCATYGQDVTVCPSYGGLFVIKMASRWYLHGIATGEPSHRGACFGKDVLFTSLSSYTQWIQDTMQLKYI